MTAQTSVAEHAPSPIAEIRYQLDNMSGQFKATLPAHIPVDRFARVVMTAIQNNPELLECERRSLWNAAVKAAQDGLMPDGREGAMVVRWDQKRGKVANWQPMIAGIRKKVRNSGEIATWDVSVVYANDAFEYELGDNPFIRHKPTLGDTGPAVAVYSVATLKGGEKSREVMSIAKVLELRDRYSDGWKAFKAGKIKSTPWSTSEDEMAKKTVARRHSKVLPMSTDLDEMLRRATDEAFDDAKPEPKTVRPGTLTTRLDALAQISAHDPDTGEITAEPEEQASQQAATTAPAAGQPASGSIPSQAGEAAPIPEPTTALEYVTTRRNWIETLLDADAGITRWDAEKELRGKLKVHTEARRELQESLKAKVASLRGGAE